MGALFGQATQTAARASFCTAHASHSGHNHIPAAADSVSFIFDNDDGDDDVQAKDFVAVADEKIRVGIAADSAASDNVIANAMMAYSGLTRQAILQSTCRSTAPRHEKSPPFRMPEQGSGHGHG